MMFLGTASRVATDDMTCYCTVPTPETLHVSASTAKPDRDCFRAVSLGVRLFANMMAGHTLVKILSGFAWLQALTWGPLAKN